MGGGSLGRGGEWLGRGDGRITQIVTKSAIRAHAIYETFALPSDTKLWENHANSEQQARSVPSITCGTVFDSRPPKPSSGGVLGPLCELESEMPQNDPLDAP